VTRLPATRRAYPALAAALGAALLVPLAPAYADGPGYGGSADKLSVKWSTAGAVSASGTTFTPPGTPTLVVTGLGFRSRSPVVVQVGDQGSTSSRSDEVGELRIAVDADAGVDEPGTSVLATGRAPSGTTRVLVGAIPPRPGGVGPMDVVPWLVGGALALWAALSVLGRRRRAASGR
jgi:hypothetical protein